MSIVQVIIVSLPENKKQNCRQLHQCNLEVMNAAILIQEEDCVFLHSGNIQTRNIIQVSKYLMQRERQRDGRKENLL